MRLDVDYAKAERNTATYDETMENQRPPEPDVPKKARRRIYPPSYKVRILKECESLPPRERAALLRREGLYSSHIVSWRKTFAKGGEASLDIARGRKPNPMAKELAALRRENERLERELSKSRKVIEIQGKLSALLEELNLGSAEEDEQSR